MLSLVIHGIVIALLISISSRSIRQFGTREFTHLVDTNRTPLIAPYLSRGGGGGGGRAPLPASAGDLSRLARPQFVPPSTAPSEFKPVLMMEATLVAPVEAQLPNPLLTRIGDPFGRVGPPSDGPGSNGGIGAGTDGGIGNRRGPGFGDHDGGGVEFNGKIGGGVVAPVVLHRVDPEFSEEARKAKYQGTVLLTIEVGEDGKPHAIRVVRGLGLGLDEKAIEAVSQWKFKPATRNGRPVPAPATIEVNFRLL
jgi:periplasmic protein TonB